MRISSPGGFRILVCVLAILAVPARSSAEDTTNAALISDTDNTTWAQRMHQVMGGNETPGSSSTIRGPQGIYAVVQLANRIDKAKAAVNPTNKTLPNEPELVEQAFTYYYGYLLANPAVSGLVLLVEWKDINPADPGADPSAPAKGSIVFDYLDAAFNAIDDWNKQNPKAPRKTLMLVVTPGFNTPLWVLDLLDSCDGLFETPAPMPGALSGCGKTKIFYRTEAKPHKQLALPLPWNSTYKAKWKLFLQAINDHITSNKTYARSFVSIAVAGPTASSAEIIMPNGNSGTATSPNENSGTLTVPGVSNAVPVDVYTAWNCLFGNNYGVTGNCIGNPTYGASSSHINTERAFIEEWDDAIDTYAGIFKDVTLVVITGKGLPEFSNAVSAYQMPPPAFAPDCGPTPTMDCSAETAILAHFAGPPSGGPNAKATEEDGLVPTGGTILSGLGVKWLSGYTHAPGLSVLNGSTAVVSRMLGGLQTAHPFSNSSPPEQDLLGVLQIYFEGTAAGGAFGNPPGSSGSPNNGGQILMDAPINYLQFYDGDILYAYGWASCSWDALMSKPEKNGYPPGCPRENMKRDVHTISVPALGGTKHPQTAQDLLNIASDAILTLTAEPATLPPLGCSGSYVQRQAFPGDVVCVAKSQRTQAATDNAAALSPDPAKSSYGTNYTNPAFNVPYGICKSNTAQYRQAYMGDLVCVASDTASQVASDNAAFPGRFCYKFPGELGAGCN